MSTGTNPISADESMKKLKEGNERFVNNVAKRFDAKARRAELVGGQHPFVTILSCSDSRVVPEYIFDAMPGELFIVRTAGNVADNIALGSIEYGCEHLHTPLLIVLGHASCGAVKATCDCKGDCKEGHIKDIVDAVCPAAKEKNWQFDDAIKNNAKCSLDSIVSRSGIVSHLKKEGKLKVAYAYYHLDSGKVDFMQ